MALSRRGIFQSLGLLMGRAALKPIDMVPVETTPPVAPLDAQPSEGPSLLYFDGETLMVRNSRGRVTRLG